MRGAAWVPVALLAAGCTVAGPRPGPDAEDPLPGTPTAAPEVRVGLAVDSPSLRLDATGPFEIVDDAGRVRASGRAGSAWTARRTGEGVEMSGPGETVRVRGILVVQPTGGGEVLVNGRRYRGSVLVRPGERGVTAVNVLDMETYLLGVVPHEIGAGRPETELEAVKAQAIAARTYAVRHMGRRASLGFDFYATVQDQVYGGAETDDPLSTRAVEETRGEVLTYEGEPIEAYYHSTCGGRTAALEEVWRGEPRPYLRSVSDERPGGGWYCESSNRFRWTVRWDRAELLEALERGLGEHLRRDVDVTTVRAMALTGRTRSGRAEALRLRTNLGEHVVRGDSVRWILRPEPGRILNSARIELHPEEANGEIVGLEVQGGGWGHGIGMCQIGAVGRAREGHSYRDILLTYYPGSRISRLYR